MRFPTKEQVAAYRRDGFLLVEGFLDDAQLARWRAATDAAVAERHDEHGDEYYRRVFLQLQRLADTNEAMAELIPRRAARRDRGVACGSRRPARVARPGADQAAVRQPDRMAPRQPVLVVPLA